MSCEIKRDGPSVPEEEIERDELNSLKGELEALRQEIGNADITVKLKALLLSEISRLLDSLWDYSVGGAAGIRDAVSTSFGRIVVVKDILVPAHENPLVTRFYTLVGRIA